MADKKKARELHLARRVVAVRGGGEVVAEPRIWPDAWLVPYVGERTPMEVVAAPPRRHGEPTSAGSRMIRDQKAAERQQNDLVRQGLPALIVNNYETITVVVPGDRAPLASEPMHPVAWMLAAIRQKQGMYYDQAAPTIFVVDALDCMPLYQWELGELAALLDADGCPFPEVWLCPELRNDEVQRIR